jgi:hypothetical protein
MNNILEHYREALIKAERAIKYAECCIDSFTDPIKSKPDPYRKYYRRNKND